MSQIKSVSIVGMGALGVMFGALFARELGGQSVTFIADNKRIQRYREEGVYANGVKYEFTFSDGSNPHQFADLLIFAVKGTALEQAIAQAKKLVGPDTIILSLLNGIVSEELIGTAYNCGQVLCSVAQGMDAVKLGNQLTYTNFGQLCIGALTDTPEQQNALAQVVELFNRVHMPHTVDKDIRHRMWSKWMLNVGVNQVVMVERGTYDTIQKPGKARDMMLAAMREVMALSKYEGVTLTEEDIKYYVDIVDGLNPGGMPSMRQDGIEKRPSEVTFFAGTVLEKSQKYGLDTPVNASLYQTITEMEKDYI